MRTSTVYLLAGICEAMEKLVHTLAVVLEKQRPVAGINGRRSSLWLDDIRVRVRLYERHCCGCGG